MNKYDVTMDTINELEKKLRDIQMLDDMLRVEYAGMEANVHIGDFLHALYHVIKKKKDERRSNIGIKL